MPEPFGSRLRIALFMHSLNPRGGVVHTLELANALHGAGHAVTVFAPATAGQSLFRTVRHAVECMPVAEVSGELADRVGARIDACTAYLRRRLPGAGFDVLHTQDSLTGNALATLRADGVIGGFARTVHHLDTFDDTRLGAWQLRALLAAQHVMCVSQLWVDTLRRQHGLDAALVANGVDRARFTPQPGPGDADVACRLGLRPGAPLLLAVGGIEGRKNSRRVLQAFALLRRVHPAAQLAIVGGATLLDHGDEVRGFAEDLVALGLRAGHDVVVAGPVADADMPPLMRLADALLMPSLREGFGLVVLEALASGTPVVVSRIAPFTEYLSPDGDGWTWADPMHAPSIADAMALALAPSRKAALRAAPPAVLDRFGWGTSAARHVALYRAHHALDTRFT